MRFLPTDLIGIELAKEVNCLRHLFKFVLTSGTYRYTDADIDIYFNGVWWYSRGIEFDAAKYSLSPKVDSIQFSIDNVAREISAIIMSEETRGKECTIYRVALDKNMQIIGEAVILFLGYLDAIEIDNQRVRFEVYNHFIRWKMMTPRRFHQATCIWTFKSTQCGYSGAETWCDHSWDRCVALTPIGSQGWRNGSAFVNDETIEGNPWSNPNKAQYSDDDRASVHLNYQGKSNYLKATGFGFSISPGATITGIRVDVEKRVGGTDAVKDYSAKIVKGGTIQGSEKASATPWPTNEAYITYGGSSDLWGLSWTVSDINAANFGFVISAQNFISQDPDYGFDTYIDHIRIFVYGTIAGQNIPKFNFGGFRWLPSLIGKQIWWGRSPK